MSMAIPATAFSSSADRIRGGTGGYNMAPIQMGRIDSRGTRLGSGARDVR
jgi:hypothetical protein